MSNSINIQNAKAYPVDPSQLNRAIETTLEYHNKPKGYSLSIVVTDNETVRQLNQQFRGVDTPTDVLSFPAEIPNYDDVDDSKYLGDLVIAYPYAQMQAEKNQHSMTDSLILLVIHGTLHLLGYDHNTSDNRAEMWSVQATILKELNISPLIVPELESESLS